MISRLKLLLLLVMLCFTPLAVNRNVVTAEEEVFPKLVAPILETRCVVCHNEQRAEGGLSLATAKRALAGGDSGAAISPGKPDDSLLLDYVSGDEPEMPKEDKPLAAAELAVLRKWITAGAVWPRSVTLQARDGWWSRQTLTQPTPPTIETSEQHRVKTPIDAFVIAKLQEKGMRLSPQADARSLVRRLYFDLIGLPPSPDELSQWTKRLNESPEGKLNETAYAELVDELLASPHYGERWARHWLDVVKYADTCGYDKDKLRPNAWPYRDYVIRSFNNDKNYTRFVQEQIAGDAIYPGEQDSILGLGFLAAGPWDFIGHVEVSEAKTDGKIARNLDRDEMVSNTMNAFCSVTIQCARCHNHKFDPITQEHYYGLQSVFAAIDRAERPYDVDPASARKRIELTANQAELKKQLASLEKEVATAGGDQLAALKKHVGELRTQAKPLKLPAEHGYHSQIVGAPNDAKWVQVDLGRATEISRVTLHACHDDYAGIGAGFGFPIRFRVVGSLDADFEKPIELADETASDFANPGYRPYVIEKNEKVRFIRVAATQLAERKNDYIFALAELQVFDEAGTNLAAGAKVAALDSIEAPNRWRKTNLTDGNWPQASDPLAIAELAKAETKLAAEIARIETTEIQTRRNDLTAKIEQNQKQLAALPRGKMVYAGATHFSPQGNFRPTKGKPRMVHVLNRGNIGEPLAEAIPGAIPLPTAESPRFQLAADHQESERRAALARWVTSPDHPLTWRSIVNRIWQYHFARAIVDSPNDFGRMGRSPTHPELLDWLAVEFRDGGQSFKKMHRLIVKSAVYRQLSAFQPEFAEIDAGNQFLWRMNRRRLSAEEIRDSILAVSGKLDRKMGGPGFYLFALEKTAHSPHYEYHKFDPADTKSHRRTIYRFIARSQPDPYMTTLDCADSSQSTPRRVETLTALQTLAMLNNRFNLKMAEYFADRLEKENATPAEQIEQATKLLIGRPPTAEEATKFAAYADEHGMANLCRMMFNLSEFIYLD